MKNKILDALKPKFEGVNDTILGRIADKLAKTAKADEDVATLVEGVTFQQVLESYGDSRATEAQQSAVANYEKKHGLKDGKKLNLKQDKKEDSDVKDDDKKDSDDVPAWAKVLIESNKALTSRLENIEGEKRTNSRKSALDKVLKDAPEKIRQRYEKDFSRMNFNDDDDFKGWIDEITPDVESIVNDYNTKGGVVTRPKTGGGSNKGEENPHLKARIAEQKAETSAPAIIGLDNNNNK